MSCVAIVLACTYLEVLYRTAQEYHKINYGSLTTSISLVHDLQLTMKTPHESRTAKCPPPLRSNIKYNNTGQGFFPLRFPSRSWCTSDIMPAIVLSVIKPPPKHPYMIGMHTLFSRILPQLLCFSLHLFPIDIEILYRMRSIPSLDTMKSIRHPP